MNKHSSLAIGILALIAAFLIVVSSFAAEKAEKIGKSGDKLIYKINDAVLLLSEGDLIDGCTVSIGGLSCPSGAKVDVVDAEKAWSDERAKLLAEIQALKANTIKVSSQVPAKAEIIVPKEVVTVTNLQIKADQAPQKVAQPPVATVPSPIISKPTLNADNATKTAVCPAVPRNDKALALQTDLDKLSLINKSLQVALDGAKKENMDLSSEVKKQKQAIDVSRQTFQQTVECQKVNKTNVEALHVKALAIEKLSVELKKADEQLKGAKGKSDTGSSTAKASEEVQALRRQLVEKEKQYETLANYVRYVFKNTQAPASAKATETN